MKRGLTQLLAMLLLLTIPLTLLWPCLVGENTYVPWDIAQFAPARTTMDDAEVQAVTRNNNTVITEVPVMFVPELRFLKHELSRGEFPHWNPYSRSGTPAWSSSILGVWYPLNSLLLLQDDPEQGLALGAGFAIAIAALLMYGFLVSLGLSLPAAMFGALVFALSGTLTVNLHFYQRINALIWLPGLLWAIRSISLRQGVHRLPAVLGLTLCMFMTHTAGFPPFALAVTLISVAFTAYLMAGALRRDGIRATYGLGLAIAGGALLGVLMGTVQTLPMFEFFPESNRTMEPSGNALAAGGYDPAGWLGYLCPTLFNHPHLNYVGGLEDRFSPLFWFLFSRSSWAAENGIPADTVFAPNLNFCEYTVFVGTLTLFLAVIGLFARNTPLRGFAIAGLAFLMLMASAHPLTERVLSAAPFRWIPPTRYTGPTCMFVALLAAAGLQGIRSVPTLLRRLLWTGGYLLSSGFAALAWWAARQTPAEFLDALTPGIQAKYAARFPKVPFDDLAAFIHKFMASEIPMAKVQMVANLSTAAIAMALCATVLLVLPRVLRWRRGHAAVIAMAFFMTGYELLSFGIPLNAGRELLRRPLNDTPVHAFLRQQRDFYASSGGFSVLRAHDSRGDENPVTLPAQLPPDTLLNEHIRDQQAYTFVDRRSHLPFLALYGPEQLARSTWPMSVRDSKLLELPYWDMLGVRFLLSEDRLEFAGKRVGPLLEGPANATGERHRFYIYERAHPLPRAWIVHDIQVVGSGIDADADDQAVVEVLVAPGFRPQDIAILDHTTAASLAANAHHSKTPGNSRKLRFPIAHQTSKLSLEVEAGEAGYLVVNDTQMNGWTVEVNGLPAPILRANLFQRLVQLPAQACKVEFRYVTPGFYAGLALSVLSLLIALGLLAWFLCSGRRKTPGQYMGGAREPGSARSFPDS